MEKQGRHYHGCSFAQNPTIHSYRFNKSDEVALKSERKFNLLLYFMRIAIIIPYIPSTPAITTGMIDLNSRSDFSTATDTIPTPDLAVP